ncbi:hypothetical protein R6Q57_016802 [Mikania cordata]
MATRLWYIRFLGELLDVNVLYVVTQTEENETDGVLTQIQVDQADVGGGLGASDVRNTFESSTEGSNIFDSTSDGGYLNAPEYFNEEECLDGEEEDSDYIVDMENLIDDIEVYMDDFANFVDMGTDFEGLEEYFQDVEQDINEAYDVDIDDFDSMTDEENETPLKKNLRRERKKKNRNRDPVAEPFYVGQCFTNRNDIRGIEKTLAVESRRQLKIVRNDPERFRVVCEGNNVNSECASGTKKVPPTKKSRM